MTDLRGLINVAEFEAAAKERLPAASFAYVASAAGSEATLRENSAAFERWSFRPRVLVKVRERDLSTTVLGTRVDLPVLIAPFSLQCLLDPDGEVATARAATAAGTVMAVSMGSNRLMEDIAAAAGRPVWFQPYLSDDDAIVQDMARRAERAGYSALCLTLDSPVIGWREAQMRQPPVLPDGVTWANMPAEYKRPGGGRWLSGADWDWSTMDALRSVTKLPIVLKGIMTPEDAELAVAHGASAIVVSNHGGRQLDGTMATLDALPAIVEKVRGRTEVLMDGGVRRGTDVLKALALGARAVLIGRAAAWGLAVGGQAGVERVLQIIRDELSTGMAILGAPRIDQIRPEHIAPRPR